MDESHGVLAIFLVSSIFRFTFISWTIVSLYSSCLLSNWCRSAIFSSVSELSPDARLIPVINTDISDRRLPAWSPKVLPWSHKLLSSSLNDLCTSPPLTGSIFAWVLFESDDWVSWISGTRAYWLSGTRGRGEFSDRVSTGLFNKFALYSSWKISQDFCT